MKIGLSIVSAAVLFLSALSQASLAQMAPDEGAGPAIKEDGGKEVSAERFKEMKSRVLAILEERRNRLDQEKACVEAATSAAELRKCRPERPEGRGGRFPMGGDHQGRQWGPPMGGPQ